MFLVLSLGTTGKCVATFSSFPPCKYLYTWLGLPSASLLHAQLSQPPQGANNEKCFPGLDHYKQGIIGQGYESWSSLGCSSHLTTGVTGSRRIQGEEYPERRKQGKSQDHRPAFWELRTPTSSKNFLE